MISHSKRLATVSAALIISVIAALIDALFVGLSVADNDSTMNEFKTSFADSESVAVANSVINATNLLREDIESVAVDVSDTARE